MATLYAVLGIAGVASLIAHLLVGIQNRDRLDRLASLIEAQKAKG